MRESWIGKTDRAGWAPVPHRNVLFSILTRLSGSSWTNPGASSPSRLVSSCRRKLLHPERSPLSGHLLIAANSILWINDSNTIHHPQDALTVEERLYSGFLLERQDLLVSSKHFFWSIFSGFHTPSNALCLPCALKPLKLGTWCSFTPPLLALPGWLLSS